MHKQPFSPSGKHKLSFLFVRQRPLLVKSVVGSAQTFLIRNGALKCVQKFTIDLMKFNIPLKRKITYILYRVGDVNAMFFVDLAVKRKRKLCPGAKQSYFGYHCKVVSQTSKKHDKQNDLLRLKITQNFAKLAFIPGSADFCQRPPHLYSLNILFPG